MHALSESSASIRNADCLGTLSCVGGWCVRIVRACRENNNVKSTRIDAMNLATRRYGKWHRTFIVVLKRVTHASSSLRARWRLYVGVHRAQAAVWLRFHSRPVLAPSFHRPRTIITRVLLYDIFQMFFRTQQYSWTFLWLSNAVVLLMYIKYT